MEETNPTETLTTEDKSLRDIVAEVASEDINREAFFKIGKAACERGAPLDEVKTLLGDWDSFAQSLSSKTVAGVLQGYCLLLAGEQEAAEAALKAHRRHPWGHYYYVHLLRQRFRTEEALSAAEDGVDKFPDFTLLKYLLADIQCRLKKFDEAEKLIKKLEKEDADAPELQFVKGVHQERMGEYREAVEHYREAIRRNEHYQEAYFRLGFLLDLHGTEADEANDEAIEAYEACVKLEPVHTNAVVNLGLLYEDRERYHDAIKCYETVLRSYPNHVRARLYLGDAQAATKMFYDKDQEKKADRQSQVLKIPVTDFELSVRSRNCLAKMNIKTLGDLIMKTEQELLSYKNFGETSLDEIKVMLTQKGLRLGQGLEDQARAEPAARNPLEATASQEILNRAIDELDLSVRSRRCMERLGVRTVRELINKTEVELMAAKNFGMTSLNEIKRKLSELNMALRG